MATTFSGLPKIFNGPGGELRMALQQLKAQFPDEPAGGVLDEGEEIARVMDACEEAVAVDQRSGVYTPAGLAQRKRLHVQRLAELIAQKEVRIANLDRSKQQTFEAAMAKLRRPVADVLDFHQVQALQQFLRSQDPVVVRLSAVTYASTGQREDLLRAALLEPRPLAAASGEYRPILDDDGIAAIEQAIRDRVGPQGDDAWREQALRSIVAIARKYIASVAGTL